jgi:hypothetical protein
MDETIEVTEDTANKIESIAERQEIDVESVQETFKEKYEETDEKSVMVEDSEIEEIALRRTRAEYNTQNRIPTDAVEMLTIGGSVRNLNDGDIFVGKALVDVDPNGNGRNFLSTVFVDPEHLNLSHVQDAFNSVGNIIVGDFGVFEAFSDKFRVLRSSEDTEIDVTFPDDRLPMVEDIRDAVPEASIETITEDASATQRSDDGELYPANFGVDIRRMKVDIYGGYKNPEDGYGVYTVVDGTVFDEEDIVESPVFDAEEAGENATPGLTCWTNPSMMEYGIGSHVEIYGVIQENDGIYQMNVDGIIPRAIEGEFDGYVDEGSDEGEAPERESTGTVDRTSI